METITDSTGQTLTPDLSSHATENAYGVNSKSKSELDAGQAYPTELSNSGKVVCKVLPKG